MEEFKMENNLYDIAELVKEGYTNGILENGVTWSMEKEEQDNKMLDEHIAELIKEGYTSGACPSWSLEVNE